jgi:HD-GYP domain-containing protein (c-di-GMP phosphodiesterase class II)
MCQFLVLEEIQASKTGLTISEIVDKTGIPINSLKEIINSLIKIKLIGKSSGTSIETIKIIENKNFSYEKNKISIYSMVQNINSNSNSNSKSNSNPTKQTEKSREFLHDRNIIVYANVIDYVKKNKYFYPDTISESIKYSIPFTISCEQIEYSINQALKDSIVKQISIGTNSNSSEQIMYKYNE